MFFFDDATDIRVLGVSGKAGSGKDYLAKSVAWRFGFIPLSLATPFKVEIAAHNPQYAFNEVFGFVERSEEVRELLQLRGTEEGRHKHGENIWCRHIEAWMKYFVDYGYDRFIIPDVRFPNEVVWIQRLGGSVVRVTGRGGIKNDRGNHESETSLDNRDDLFDAMFDNSPELELNSVERFTELTRELMNVR